MTKFEQLRQEQGKKGHQGSNWLTIEMVSRHEKVVATQNLVEGKTVRLRHEVVVVTQALGDQKKLS